MRADKTPEMALPVQMKHTSVIRRGFHCLCYERTYPTNTYHSTGYACFGLACLGEGLAHYLFLAFHLYNLVDFIPSSTYPCRAFFTFLLLFSCKEPCHESNQATAAPSSLADLGKPSLHQHSTLGNSRHLHRNHGHSRAQNHQVQRPLLDLLQPLG